MKSYAIALCLLLLMTSFSAADVIKPNDVRATSQFGVGLNVENLVNGDQGAEIGLPHYGLISAGGAGVLDDEHGVVYSGTPDQWGWISGCNDGGIPGGDPGVDCGTDPFAVEPVDEQIVEFEFDGAYDLTDIHLWNDNEDGFVERGVDEFTIEVNTSRTGGTWTPIAGTYNLTKDLGFLNNVAQDKALVASGVRRVRLVINSNHLPGEELYVGLSEVRFSGTLVTLDLAADGNKNGFTDGVDFLLMQRNFGLGQLETFLNSTLSATQSEGDYDNDNYINDDDFAAWAAEFGSAAPAIAAATSAAIPEPSTLMLLLTASSCSLMVRNRKRRKQITET